MLINKLITLALFVSLFSSCTKTVYYQVYKTEHPDLQKIDDNLLYENKDCSISYNLWAEHGDPGFTVYNKTDKDLFIIMPRTFFIINDVAQDYYKNREFISNQRVSTIKSTGSYSEEKTINNIGSAISNGKGVTIKESPIICIPPKCKKIISEYPIMTTHIRVCDQEFPKESSNHIEYSKEDSPVIFKNIIAYSFTPEDTNLHIIENEFWVSRLTNYRGNAILKKRKVQDCPEDIQKIIKINTKKSPENFYNTYSLQAKLSMSKHEISE